MQGIMGFKGNVHVAFGEALSEDGNPATSELPYNDWVKGVAEKIDRQIYSHYKLWKSNYMAYDILRNGNTFSNKYSSKEKEEFINLINKRTEAVPEHLDRAEIMAILLNIYANPVKNFLENR